MLLILAALLVLSFGIVESGTTFSSIPNFSVTDDDLHKLIALMRSSDADKPEYCDVHLNYQGYYEGGDGAPASLFANVNEAVLKRDSFVKLLALRKFFNPRTGVPEQTSPAKSQAIENFLDTVWKSGPFSWLITFLRNKKHPWADSSVTLRSAIKQIWFDNFSRKFGKLDSSAFEHIFMGEEKNGEVSGMHSWPIMYELERTPSEKFDYRGYFKKRYDVIAEVNLMWRGFEKKTGSFFANSSPSFDFSVLTACFLTHRGKGDKCRIIVDGCELAVQSYDMEQNGKVFIGTAYPEIGRASQSCDQLYSKRQMCCMK